MSYDAGNPISQYDAELLRLEIEQLKTERDRLLAAVAWLAKYAISAWPDDCEVFNSGPAEVDAGAAFLLAYVLENVEDQYCTFPEPPIRAVVQFFRDQLEAETAEEACLDQKEAEQAAGFLRGIQEGSEAAEAEAEGEEEIVCEDTGEMKKD